MTYRQALDQIALFGSLIAALLYGDVIASQIATLPTVVPATIILGFVAWTGIAVARMRAETVPATVLFGGLAGVLIGTYSQLGSMFAIGQVLTAVVAFPVGIVAWLVLLLIAACITGSILGLDVQTSRYRHGDDPYGDPHAAEILEEPNS